MKIVVNKYNVAHLFANQLQTEAKTPTRNFYFRNKSIYSYGLHFCIAKFINEDTVLFTQRGYSNTTAKHILITNSALSHKNKIYCKNPEGTNEENFEFWQNQVLQLSGKLTKAKKPALYTTQIGSVIDTAKKYADFMKVSLPIELVEAQKIMSKESSISFINNLSKIRQDEEKKKHTEQVKKFRSFKTNYIYNRNGFDYLRKSENFIESSQGIEIPIEIGIEFYKNLNEIKPGCKLMEYTVIENNKDFIKIGCHTIKKSEIKNLFKNL
jgi:hypothetical protein